MTPLFPTTGDWQADRAAAVAWAREVLTDPDARLLDSETTGLQGSEIVQLGILSVSGETLLDTLVKPMCPIGRAATAIHGIRDTHVADAPTLDSLLPRLAELLHGRRVIVYNAAFDFEVLYGCLVRRWTAAVTTETEMQDGFPNVKRAREWMNACRWECAMLPYSAWEGACNEYYESYRWQRLPGSDHSAIGDCTACLEVIRRMAGTKDSDPSWRDWENEEEWKRL